MKAQFFCVSAKPDSERHICATAILDRHNYAVWLAWCRKQGAYIASMPGHRKDGYMADYTWHARIHVSAA